jgi:ABC-type multidrug transport system ATPase subunit
MHLQIEALGKRYQKDFWALRDFTLESGPGVLGLLGPNGAGKSTLMRMLATVMPPTEGRITWNAVDVNENPNALRRVLGYLPQEFGVYPHLNAVEFLSYMAAAKGLRGRAMRYRIDELLHLVHLQEAARRPLGGYSGGMRRRVGIAQALLNDPELLIVDEPTAGLDPEERVGFRNLLSELAHDRLVILSTHIVSDVEAVATSIAILNRGRLVVHALPEEIVAAVADQVWTWVTSSQALPELKQRHLISNATRRSDGVHVRGVADGAPTADASPAPATLEDAYLYYVRTSRESVAVRS